MTIADQVKNVIVTELGVTPDEVCPEARLGEQLGADSLDALNLTLALEERFEIEISDGDAIELQTVGDVVAYVERQLDPLTRRF